MGQEYEIIPHNSSSYRIFVVRLISRTPHIHRDYEFNTVLDGKVSLELPGGGAELKKGDCFIINPLMSHSLSAKRPVTILSLQVSPSFFTRDDPKLPMTHFDHSLVTGESGNEVRRELENLSEVYLGQGRFYGMRTAARVLDLFCRLLETQQNHLLTSEEEDNTSRKATRMMDLISYIDEHYQEKLLLRDIAEDFGLNLYYLSHFFKNAFGFSFQDYLGKVRCEHARQLLTVTGLPLLDISIACGFSDPKYFNRNFEKCYGMRPRDYRKRYHLEAPSERPGADETVQRILTREEALRTLHAVMEDRKEKA